LFTDSLRRELGLEPSPELNRLIPHARRALRPVGDAGVTMAGS
jgi:hypothetical protein